MKSLYYKDLGRLGYEACLELQDKLVSLKTGAEYPDFLLFVQHPNVYTLGRGGNPANVIASRGISVLRTTRGGDITYHGPGQLVIYPVVDLKTKLRRDVHRFVRNFEEALIRTLRQFKLAGARKPPFTGVWIENKKIAAMGLAVKRGIAYHGAALNVNTDLSYFRNIVPCGLPWAGVTSMELELRSAQDLSIVRDQFLANFTKIFKYTFVEQISKGIEFNPESYAAIVTATAFHGNPGTLHASKTP